MKTHETYVSLDTAKQLKKAGFDWECNESYRGGRTEAVSGMYINWNSSSHEGLSISAPTLSVAQRWLREVKDIWCEVTICFVMEDALMKTKYHVQCISTDYNNLEMIDCHNIETDTPEEALEAGIKNCIEIILKEK